MTSDDGLKVKMDCIVDEAWQFYAPPVSPNTSKWFQNLGTPAPIGAISWDPESPKFDPQIIYKQARLDRSDTGVMPDGTKFYMSHGHVAPGLKKQIKELNDLIYKELGLPSSVQPSQKITDELVNVDYGFDVQSWLKAEMQFLLNEEIAKSMESALYGDGSPLHKENNMSDRTLRTPESSTVKTKDLTVALRVLGHGYSDEILDALALVQDLKTGERLVKASKLKPQDVGSHLQIIDGQSGVLSDLRDYDTFGRQSNGFIKAVIGGKMYDLRPDDFVVLTALAN